MTKFIFISDTHMGANPMNYQQQKGYPEKLPEILSQLNNYIKTNADIDFVLHGGDMIDFTSEEIITRATKYFDFDIPTHLCLGNHDLTTRNALESWLRLAPQYFINNEPCYTIVNNDCIVHVAPNHWEKENEYYWGDQQNAFFSEDQISTLTMALNKSTHLPHILLTHSPTFGLPTDQTGFAEDYHSANSNFNKTLTDLSKDHAHLKCILGGHNHLNMHIKNDETHYATASSFAESPFDFKLFEISQRTFSMQTISLADSMGFQVEYNHEKEYVQGRPIDRSFEINL